MAYAPNPDWQSGPSSDFIRGKEWAGLAGVAAVHAALLFGLVHFGTGKPPEVIKPPAVIGIVLPAAPPAEAQPVKPAPAPSKPVEPKRTEPKPAISPKPSAVKAPPSQRAVTAPRTEDTAARDERKNEVNATPAMPASTPAAPSTPSPATAPIMPPRTDASHLKNEQPGYPSASRRMGEEGEVLLDVHIQADGSVGEIKLKRSSGYPRLDDAAIQAVRHWRYIPARRGNEAIAYWYVQPIRFALND